MEIGSRSIVSTVQHLAATRPEKACLVLPKDDHDLSKGFENLTYARLDEASSAAAWWLEKTLGIHQAPFPTFAYQGPNDPRAIILSIAAAKTRRTILLLSPSASAAAQQGLLKTAGCETYLHGASFVPKFDKSAVGIPTFTIPELDEWLSPPAVVPSFHLRLSWEEHKSDPWIILHTSGTSGMPKVIRHNHMTMTYMDMALMTAKTEGSNMSDEAAGKRFYCGVPSYHLVGLIIALQCTVLLGTECVLGPAHTPPTTTEELLEIMETARPYGIVVAPADVEKLAASSRGWKCIERLGVVQYVGAPLRKALGDEIQARGVLVASGFGSSEQGTYPQVLRRDAEWDWLTFSNSMGAKFYRYPGDEGVYELVFEKQPGAERFQTIFQVFPDLDTYSTKDLFHKHDSIPDTWKYAGRADDFIKLVSGYGILAARIEDIIAERTKQLIEGVAMAGAGRPTACVLLMPRQEALDEVNGDSKLLLEKIWPAIVEANSTCGELGRIPKRAVLIAPRSKPFKKTGKGTVNRRETVAEYEQEIAGLYGD